MWRFPNLAKCIISYQEVLLSVLKNGMYYADEVMICNHSTNGQLLKTSVLTGFLCCGVLWNFFLSLNCDSWAIEGKLFFWIHLFDENIVGIQLHLYHLSNRLFVITCALNTLHQLYDWFHTALIEPDAARDLQWHCWVPVCLPFLSSYLYCV